MSRRATIGLIAAGVVCLASGQALAQPGTVDVPGEDGSAPAEAPAPAPATPPAPASSPDVPTAMPTPAPPPVRIGPKQSGPPSFDAVNPDFRAHTGFFARALIGTSYQRTSQELVGFEDGGKSVVTGLGFSWSLALGYAILPRLVLQAEVSAVAVNEPSRTLGGTDNGKFDGTVSAGGLGAGATYYLASNAYFSGGVLLGSTQANPKNAEKSQSKTGLLTSLVAGKEWWVSGDIGLGVVAQLLLGTFEPEQGDSNISTASFALSFSATYN